MKPIIVDMKEMSDSREVYESRPHPFFIWFIYLLIVITVAAIAWAAIFQIDIVVTGTGTVAAKEEASTVTNTKSGIVTECYITDGQKVEKGELLYEVEHDDLELQLESYESRLTEYEQQLEMMNVYLDWLSDDTVSLEAYADNPFYTEYSARSKLVELNTEAVVQEYNNTQDTYQAQLSASETMVSYYESEIEKLNQLSSAVKNRSNPFSSEDTYYYAKVHDYITQYNNLAAQYEESITELQEELGEANKQLSEKQTVLAEAEQEVSDTQTALAEIEQKISEAQTAHAETEQEISEEQTAHAETEQEVSEEQTVHAETGQEISEEQTALANTRTALEETLAAAQVKVEEASALIAEQEAIVKEKQQSIISSKTQKQTALTNLETETVASIEASILTYQQNLLTSQGSQTEIESAISSTAKTGTADSVENLTQTEIQAVTAEISSCQTQIKEIEKTVAELESEIEDTAVCAPISGTINLSEKIVAGNYLAAGTNVLTIIPDGEDGFVVQAYIDNGDIAQIEENMPVKYEIAAYPSSEYGVMTGEVSFVSADLKASDETGSAYYMIETTIDDADLYNESGEQAALKIGMLCEAKIIVEQKSVLTYLLEKVKLID